MQVQVTTDPSRLRGGSCSNTFVGTVDIVLATMKPRNGASLFKIAGGVMRYEQQEPLVAILEAEDLRELMSGRAVSFGHVAQAIRLDPWINAERTLKAMNLYLENVDFD